MEKDLEQAIIDRDGAEIELQISISEVCAAIKEIQKFCGEWIKDAASHAEIARSLGHEDRAKGFENRTNALRGVLKIMERHGIPDLKL